MISKSQKFWSNFISVDAKKIKKGCVYEQYFGLMLFIVDTKLPVAYEQKIPRFGVMLFMIDAKPQIVQRFGVMLFMIDTEYQTHKRFVSTVMTGMNQKQNKAQPTLSGDNILLRNSNSRHIAQI